MTGADTSCSRIFMQNILQTQGNGSATQGSMIDSIIKIITEAAALLNSTLETINTFRDEMNKLSSQLPEYKTVMELYGVGKVFCSQIIAEIGDVRRLERSKSIVALAGIDPPPNQSGKSDV